jgi:nucleoid-associated protein YgaU
MATQEERLNTLKQKYQSVLNMVQQQQVRLEHLHVQDNKLFIGGVAPSEEAKNRVWDQIKLVDPTFGDLTADIRVEQQARPETQTAGAAFGGGQRTQTYTVQPGDTLSKISQRFYGDASEYMRIFQANRDKLSDPDKIQAGQELTIPEFG